MKNALEAFPGGTVIKSLPVQGHGFELWSKRIPHAVEQISPYAATTAAHAP